MGRMRLGALLLASSVVAISTTALAQTPGQALYDEGVKAYSAGDLATACPKFKASFEADRVAAPLFMLAKCEEKSGKIGSALTHYEEVMRLGGLEPELRDQAARSLNDLAPRAPKLSLKRGSAPAAAVAKLDGVVYTIDGRPEPIDPGEHELVVTSPAHEPKTITFTVKEGEERTLAIEVGKELPKPPPPPVAPKAEGPDTTPLWIGGGVAAGIGVVGFIVAGITGGVILGGECDGDLSCPKREEGLETSGLVISNYVGWGVGGAGVATGAILFIVAAVQGGEAEPEGTSTGVRVTSGPAPIGLGIRATF